MEEEHERPVADGGPGNVTTMPSSPAAVLSTIIHQSSFSFIFSTLVHNLYF